MKRLLYILSLLPLGLGAQNMYNVSSIFENDLVGTARYVGMGGSMSALGADLSTMATNPAGIALFRSSDFSFTAGLNFKDNAVTYGTDCVESSKTSPFVGNASMVFALERDDEHLKFLNIALGIRKKNNLDSNFEMFGFADVFSQQYVIKNLFDGNPFDYNSLTNSVFGNLNYSWLALLAADARLGHIEDGSKTMEDFLVYSDGTLVWQPDDMNFYEEVRGGVHVADVNVSANISDRIYLGATASFSNVDYNRYTEYREMDALGDIYMLESNSFIKGNGFDLKLGAIFRPFKYSPFKLGLSVHTPTWYVLDEYYSAVITDPDRYQFSTIDKERFGDNYIVTSKLSTPWRFNASMSYTFGTYLALNAEYEFADYTTSSFLGRSYVGKAQNEEIECNMKAQHIARVGAELNVEGIAVRAGYNYATAPFRRDAYKELGNASVVETSTDYLNRFEKNIVTLGLGFRGDMLYFDLAYMLEMQQADFYPFYDKEVANPAAQVDFLNQSLIATVGLRF